MKKIVKILLAIFVISSCNTRQTEINKQTELSIAPSVKKVRAKPKKEKNIDSIRLSELFTKAVECFPNDSASLYKLYFKGNLPTDQEKLHKQIKRLRKLISKESVNRYRSIENNLIPLMTRIVNSQTIIRLQSDSLVMLYSDYDYFFGESLFSNFLSYEENYTLVCESFRIMVEESKRDTCFISGLIQLDENIRTNVELGEMMTDFIVQAIRNNPIGFLEMYKVRNEEQRGDFANYIAVWDSPDKELIEKYSEIAEKSTNANYKELATELIGRFMN